MEFFVASKLSLYGRPYVIYDAKNSEHRKYFFEFVKSTTWGNCPVRFVLEDQGHADFVATIQRQTLEYYLDKEFDK